MKKKLIICVVCLALFMSLYSATYLDAYGVISDVVKSIEVVTDKVSTIILPGSFSSSYTDIDIFDKVVNGTTINELLINLGFNRLTDTLYQKGYTITQKSIIADLNSGYCLRWSTSQNGVIDDVYCSPNSSITFDGENYMYMVNKGFTQSFYVDTESFVNRQSSDMRIGTIMSVEESVTAEQLFNLWFTN